MREPKLTTSKAILIGQVWVNVPVLTVLMGIIAIGRQQGYPTGLCYLVAATPAWVYWSFMIPKWRRWALKNGANEDELEKWGRLTLLTYKKGSLLSKTEFKDKERE